MYRSTSALVGGVSGKAGGWAGPRAAHNEVQKRKFLILPTFEVRDLSLVQPQPVAVPTAPSWLTQHGYSFPTGLVTLSLCTPQHGERSGWSGWPRYNWTILLLGDINTETWPSRLEESQMRQ
jgi:hypothetical protein